MQTFHEFCESQDNYRLKATAAYGYTPSGKDTFVHPEGHTLKFNGMNWEHQNAKTKKVTTNPSFMAQGYEDHLAKVHGGYKKV